MKWLKDINNKIKNKNEKPFFKPRIKCMNVKKQNSKKKNACKQQLVCWYTWLINYIPKPIINSKKIYKSF